MNHASSSIARFGLVCVLCLTGSGIVARRSSRAPRTSGRGVRARRGAPADQGRGVPGRDPVDDRARPPVDRGPGDIRRRDHARRHRRSDDDPGRPQAGAAGRRDRSTRRPTAPRPCRSRTAARRSRCRSRSRRRPSSHPQLPARRHARLHAVRLQYRKLPRGGAGQGRLSHLAYSASIPMATISV